MLKTMQEPRRGSPLGHMPKPVRASKRNFVIEFLCNSMVFNFPSFGGWGKEYGAFSCSIRDKEMVISYINKQRIHHATRTFEQEYREMIERSGLEWNDYRLT